MDLMNYFFLGAFDYHYYIFFSVSTGNQTRGGLLHHYAFEAVGLTARLSCHPERPTVGANFSKGDRNVAAEAGH